MANKKKTREKIFERNPNTGVIRWRYTDESPDKFGWPNYGRILKKGEEMEVFDDTSSNTQKDESKS